MLGFNAERFDDHGVGPDVLWLLPGKNAIVFEAKSRKKERNAFNKEGHGQLLVADKWFVQHYSDHEYVMASVLATNKATKPAMAVRSDSRALTYGNLSRLVAECRKLLAELTSGKVDGESLVVECAALLKPFGVIALGAALLRRRSRGVQEGLRAAWQELLDPAKAR